MSAAPVVPSAVAGRVTGEMVDRFLSWKLPEDFHPDAGISFNPEFNVEYNAKLGLPPARHQPIGTNLLTANQARAMLEHVLAGTQSASVALSETTVLPCVGASWVRPGRHADLVCSHCSLNEHHHREVEKLFIAGRRSNAG